MKKKFIVISFITILLIINFSGCINENDNDSVKFEIVSLTVKPSLINKDEQVILSWEVVKASSVYIEGIGSVSNKGERVVFPHESIIYQLTAKNETKILTAVVEVTVIENINESQDINRDINITPVLTITKDESSNSLRIVQVDSGVKWDYININATDGTSVYYYTNLNTYVNSGDTLYFDGNGLSGSITIRLWYIPTEKIIGTYTLNGVIP